jgi:serine/threonine-protein kinase
VAVLSPGDVFGGYRIEGIAGRGGMGVVYRAVQLDLGRPVALKLIAADRAADPDFRERFQRESRMAAAIDHPNVVPVHGAGEEDGQLYLVMRYVRGTDLHALIKRDGPLAPERAARIVAQVASALDAAHAAGLVHRDVKPANVLLGGSGRDEHAYLSDFGLTRLLASETHLTQTGQWMGTIDFSAPEQLSGRRIDARADVYSLGCVLHSALVGTPPFPRGTLPATLLAHMQDPIPRPSEHGAPGGFDRVMARALAKEPERRYPSAGDLGRAALAAARGESVTESERSVAVGPAAPAPPANGHAGPPTAVTVAAPPDTAITVVERPGTRPKPEPLLPPPPAKPPRRGRRSRVVLGSAFVAIAAAVTAVGLGIGSGAGAGRPNAPLSDGDVRDVAQEFAQAYEAEDGTALRRLLTSDVQRVLPGGVARGRSRVVTEYEHQFRAQATERYELSDLVAKGGRVGRASGAYRVERKGGRAIEGKIVLGVVRDRGRPRIGLIAVTPDS